MGLTNTSPDFAPHILETAIINKYRLAATGVGLLANNPVSTDVIDSGKEEGSRGGFKFLDKGKGIPDFIQTIYSKATRTMSPYAAVLEISKRDVIVNPERVRNQIMVAGDEWAAFVDELVYTEFEKKAGYTETQMTLWSDTAAKPVDNLSLLRAKISHGTKGHVKPDTVIMGTYAAHYFATHTNQTSKQDNPTDASAYLRTGDLMPVVGMRIIVTDAVGDDVYVLKGRDVGKFDEFLPPTTYTQTGEQLGTALVHSRHGMYQWGEPTVVKPELLGVIKGVGEIETA